MKLINYKYGYNNTFNCSIHGKIIVNKSEWKSIVKYLLNPSVKSCYLYKNVLKDDFKRCINARSGKLFNIRVTATELVVRKFNIKNYKAGNYMFLVK